jgi:hypothetical protein
MASMRFCRRSSAVHVLANELRSVGMIGMIFLFIGTTKAAGPYDGTWRGASIGSYGFGCSTTTAASFMVQGDQVMGKDEISPGSFMPAGQFPIRGSVAADGSVKGDVGDWSLRGKFSGDSFDGDYEFGQCTMIMRLKRAR